MPGMGLYLEVYLRRGGEKTPGLCVVEKVSSRTDVRNGIVAKRNP
jgi:hypothetical protein